MTFLGIDTSCDETSAAVVERTSDGTCLIRSNVVSSQIDLHARFGGVVPEMASRAHIERIGPVVEAALSQAGAGVDGLHGVAVTAGPGLVGALLVGVNFAKGLAYQHGLPLVSVHHIHGHLESVFLAHPGLERELPSLALVVSGGHTALYTVENGRRSARRYARIGTTRDDAVGEAYDKVSKLLGLGYPGGPIIEKLACKGNGNAVELPRHPKIGKTVNYDFSYSGLKSAVARYVASKNIAPASSHEEALERGDICDLAASFQEAAVEMLRWTARRAAKRMKPRSLSVSGGVSVNRYLRERFATLGEELDVPAYFPPRELTTDNGAMIAYCGILGRRSALSPAKALALNARADWRF
ncbi:MAG: tRNA (adenosine(37)-N6)-threonylcarbamoyltransferase complex transferase subunit TsaD [Acidobacteriota bacterium]|nr:MAG: tRNA (adenosine(37)-N6)-threonylcarbamoyltransferase complex transferase subunit TsaD [Acidobacteriota bacterium]